MMNFVYTLCSSTPGQIQYGGFKVAPVNSNTTGTITPIFSSYDWMKPNLKQKAGTARGKWPISFPEPAIPWEGNGGSGTIRDRHTKNCMSSVLRMRWK